MSLATARATLAAQLAHETAYSTFAYPQPVPRANTIQIVPDDPYVVPTNSHDSLPVRLRVRVELYVNGLDNQSGLEAIETMARDVRARIVDATQNCGDLTAPRYVTLETGDLITAAFPVELITEW